MRWLWNKRTPDLLSKFGPEYIALVFSSFSFVLKKYGSKSVEAEQFLFIYSFLSVKKEDLKDLTRHSQKEERERGKPKG